MKKKCGNSGFFSDTSINQGAVIEKKTSKPKPKCSLFQIAQSRENAVYSISTALGSTTPIKPLDITDNAIPAQHVSIQLRCSRAVASLRWLSNSAESATVIMPAKPMSSELKCPSAPHQKLDASTRAAVNPIDSLKTRRPA